MERYWANFAALNAASVAEVPTNSLLSFFENAAWAISTSSAEDGRSVKLPRSSPRARPDLLIGLREYGTPPIARSAFCAVRGGCFCSTKGSKLVAEGE